MSGSRDIDTVAPWERYEVKRSSLPVEKQESKIFAGRSAPTWPQKRSLLSRKARKQDVCQALRAPKEVATSQKSKNARFSPGGF